jgi:hypothetical protein
MTVCALLLGLTTATGSPALQAMLHRSTVSEPQSFLFIAGALIVLSFLGRRKFRRMN